MSSFPPSPASPAPDASDAGSVSDQSVAPSFVSSPFQAGSFFQSVGFALQGLRLAVQTQRNIRIHLCITLLVLGAGVWFQVSRWEWMALIGCILLMLLAELMNTAIEWLVDLYTGHSYHAQGGQIKDLAAGACLLTAIGCAVIGMLIFWPHVRLMGQHF